MARSVILEPNLHNAYWEIDTLRDDLQLLALGPWIQGVVLLEDG